MPESTLGEVTVRIIVRVLVQDALEARMRKQLSARRELHKVERVVLLAAFAKVDACLRAMLMLLMWQVVTCHG